nr:helix-turn-helix transcriptional regulator [Ectobacillus ponti]
MQRLAELRKERKWSMQEAADRLGIAKSTYAGYESGYREPSLQSLVQLAKLFDTTIDELMGGRKPKIELAELLQGGEEVLLLQGEPLSHEELHDFISFTLMKREVRERLNEKKMV